MIMSLALWGSAFWIPVETASVSTGTDSWVRVSMIKLEDCP